VKISNIPYVASKKRLKSRVKTRVKSINSPLMIECVQLILPVGKSLGKSRFFLRYATTGPFSTDGRSVILKRQNFTLSTPTWNRCVIGSMQFNLVLFKVLTEFTHRLMPHD
jgi:hypothetical protein